MFVLHACVHEWGQSVQTKQHGVSQPLASLLQVQVHVINPLALSNNELYGSFDEGTHEWQDGVLARIMRTACKDESPDQKWILFDGPVDTLWIESMNTLLDDNKLLTLLSGERISMSPQVSTCAALYTEAAGSAAAAFATASCHPLPFARPMKGCMHTTATVSHGPSFPL